MPTTCRERCVWIQTVVVVHYYVGSNQYVGKSTFDLETFSYNSEYLICTIQTQDYSIIQNIRIFIRSSTSGEGEKNDLVISLTIFVRKCEILGGMCVPTVWSKGKGYSWIKTEFTLLQQKHPWFYCKMTSL